MNFMAQPYGLLNINKPLGPTSHTIVGGVRRLLHIKKVGHAGTLDPMATGVLVLCLGPATRLSEFVMASSKTYRARVCFGAETVSYASEGAVIATYEPLPDRTAVEAALDQFRGAIRQVPPMYSAIKQGGRRLYDLARSGREVEREARPVTITRLELIAWEPPFATLEIDCSPGTYIRSLAFDLGRAVGNGAYLAALERTASGVFTVDEAVTWEAFEAAVRAGTWREHLIAPDRALMGYPALHLDAQSAQFLCNGGMLPVGDVSGDLARAYGPDGQLIALVARHSRRGEAGWKPEKVLRGE